MHQHDKNAHHGIYYYNNPISYLIFIAYGYTCVQKFNLEFIEYYVVIILGIICFRQMDATRNIPLLVTWLLGFARLVFGNHSSS